MKLEITTPNFRPIDNTSEIVRRYYEFSDVTYEIVHEVIKITYTLEKDALLIYMLSSLNEELTEYYDTCVIRILQ